MKDYMPGTLARGMGRLGRDGEIFDNVPGNLYHLKTEFYKGLFSHYAIEGLCSLAMDIFDKHNLQDELEKDEELKEALNIVLLYPKIYEHQDGDKIRRLSRLLDETGHTLRERPYIDYLLDRIPSEEDVKETFTHENIVGIRKVVERAGIADIYKEAAPYLFED